MLFPPLTMLRVQPRAAESVDAPSASRVEAELAWEVHDRESEDGKQYKQIEVIPSFI